MSNYMVQNNMVLFATFSFWGPKRQLEPCYSQVVKIKVGKISNAIFSK
jgi:hypothetical protein